MAMKKLPDDIQHLLCASTQINSYKRATEELVYNSLDASSTSIAIRIHIEEDAIQVLDNGQGITKRDFGPLGQKYMTSKYVDMNTIKSVPDSYGFRGESLANIIKVSQTIKIISRHESSEETWIKYFCNGKEQIIKELTTRPSKGTTKKAADSMNVIQDIKTFLEQLSLVHSHISLSLRDDSKNEIVFKMHKKRDIYQTLSSLFGIDKSDFQEFKVEKNQYKVTGFIGYTDKKISKNWVFLNGKFINNNKILKIINDIMTKSVSRDQENRRANVKGCKGDPDLLLLKNKIPFYFIFVTCPYIDYDLSYAPKNSVLEFKDWEQIKKLLEKLIKFYRGDINLNEIKKPDTKLVSKEQVDTRFEVRKIMDKILGANSKKLGTSQMQKGIKGKHIKRKLKKKPIIKTLNKVMPPKNGYTKSNTSYANKLNAIGTHLHRNNINLQFNTINNKIKSVQELIPSKSSGGNHRHTATKQNTNVTKEESQQNKKSKQCKRAITERQKLNNNSNAIEWKDLRKNMLKKVSLNERFENPTDSLKKRCDIIAKKAEYLLERRKKRVREIIAAQTEERGNKLNNNKIEQIQETNCMIQNYDYTPLPSIFNKHKIDKHTLIKEKPYKTTYDLVHTILKSQQERNTHFESTYSPIKNNESVLKVSNTHLKPKNNIPNTNNSNIQFVSKLTFESHNYYNVDRIHRTTAADIANKLNNILPNKHFITEQSRDNFKLPINKRTKMHNPYNRHLNSKKSYNKREMIFNVGNSIKDNRYEETSYTIEFSEKVNQEKYDASKPELGPFNVLNYEDRRIHTSNNFDTWCYEGNCNMGNTYTVLSSSLLQNSIPVEPINVSWHAHRTYTVSNTNDTLNNGQDNRNKYANDLIRSNDASMFVFSSNSQHSNVEVIFDKTIEPLNICETILSNHDSDERDLNNKESSNINNNAVNNNFKDIEEYSNEPNFDEGDITMNHDDDLNNYVNKKRININACKDKIDSIKDGQAIGIKRNELLEMRQKVSHHFDTTTNSLTLSPLKNKEYSDKQTTSLILTSAIIKNLNEDVFDQENYRLQVPKQIEQNNKDNGNTEKYNDDQNAYLNLNKSNRIKKDLNNFYLKDRLNFIPKGMSPIFANCNNKGTCDYNLEKDYYEDSIYNNFANDVQINSEVFEPRIENMKLVTTKDIMKVNNKLEKDNASLIFNGQSLKDAKVLGQVDGKFIAAIMKGKCNVQNEISEFLILFDQHAVHERIRLESNLSDYIAGDRWKSIAVGEISLEISKDEVLYLHNYMEKFNKFGLLWTFLSNCEISINAIPEALFGKNPRPVEKVIKAVKNLISEEINMIKLQKGCVSLYPKSIMDHVFSEACRYAIKFGDKLSNNDCMELLNALSKCKTPFQCAHGRPVMAVLMDYKRENYKYEINIENLKKKIGRK